MQSRENQRNRRRPLRKCPKAPAQAFGIYYTPAAFTGLIVERTVDAIVRDRLRRIAGRIWRRSGIARDAGPDEAAGVLVGLPRRAPAYHRLRPACGSGAFLIRAYDALDAQYKSVVHGLAGAGMDPEKVASLEDSIPDLILNQNLYGVDHSQEAVEITQLALWIRSARRGKTLADLSRNIVCGNSLVSDPAVDSKAFDWHAAFPGIIGDDGGGGFTCVIGNPPWERVKVQDREFFSLTDPTPPKPSTPMSARNALPRCPRSTRS